MARICTVCTHPQLGDINARLLRGEPAKKIAAIYRDCSDDALLRHRQSHLPRELVAAQKVAAKERARDLAGQLDQLTADARTIEQKALAAQNWKVALSAIHELARLLELNARLDGKWSERRELDVRVDATGRDDTRRAILQALEPFPAARVAVAEALGETDAH